MEKLLRTRHFLNVSQNLYSKEAQFEEAFSFRLPDESKFA